MTAEIADRRQQKVVRRSTALLAEEVSFVEPWVQPSRKSRDDPQTWVALCCMSTVGKLEAHSCAWRVAELAAGHSWSTAACLLEEALAGHSRPCAVEVDSLLDNVVQEMDASACESAQTLELRSVETESETRRACCRPRKVRTTCWNRKTDCQWNDHWMNQPEATILRTKRSSAVDAAAERPGRTVRDLRTSSAAQTKLKSTDCRFLGLESGTTVAAPALRLS